MQYWKLGFLGLLVVAACRNNDDETTDDVVDCSELTTSAECSAESLCGELAGVDLCDGAEVPEFIGCSDAAADCTGVISYAAPEGSDTCYEIAGCVPQDWVTCDPQICEELTPCLEVEDESECRARTECEAYRGDPDGCDGAVDSVFIECREPADCDSGPTLMSPPDSDACYLVDCPAPAGWAPCECPPDACDTLDETECAFRQDCLSYIADDVCEIGQDGFQGCDVDPGTCADIPTYAAPPGSRDTCYEFPDTCTPPGWVSCDPARVCPGPPSCWLDFELEVHDRVGVITTAFLNDLVSVQGFGTNNCASDLVVTWNSGCTMLYVDAIGPTMSEILAPICLPTLVNEIIPPGGESRFPIVWTPLEVGSWQLTGYFADSYGSSATTTITVVP